jgi:hypothetical protein
MFKRRISIVLYFNINARGVLQSQQLDFSITDYIEKIKVGHSNRPIPQKAAEEVECGYEIFITCLNLIIR